MSIQWIISEQGKGVNSKYHYIRIHGWISKTLDPVKEARSKQPCIVRVHLESRKVKAVKTEIDQ